MKRRFSKILGVGLTVALLASLALVAGPVSALSQPSVDVDDPDISAVTEYGIIFNLGKDLPEGGKIKIEFPTGTDLTAVSAGDIGILTTSGIGSDPITDGTFSIVKSPSATTGPTLTITLTSLTGDTKIGVGAMVQVLVDDVKNPGTPGDYNLDVSTLKADDTKIESAVTSASYEIGAPTIPGLPGIVKVYNPSGILMARDTGDDAIWDLVKDAGDDFTIEVGPGTYEIFTTIDITQEGLTLVATAGAETTIIDASENSAGVSIIINAVDVTVDGFTIEADTSGIQVFGDDATVINNVVTADPWVTGIYLDASGATVSGNELDINSTMYLYTASDSTLSDNTFDAGINLVGTTSEITITDNTIIGAEYEGINFNAGDTYTDILIQGNTISETTEGDVIGICIRGAHDGLIIIGNDVTDNEGDGIRIDSAATLANSAIMFNNITGNDTSTGDYGIENNSVSDVHAAFNWWGTTVASKIADMVSGTTLGTVDYEPFLDDTVEAVFSAFDAAAGAISLDAEDEVGVKVSGATGADVIGVAAYNANPQESIADALAFFDVYVAGATVTNPTIKFYAGDKNSELYAWSAATDGWVEQTQAEFSAYGGYVYATVDADILEGTPFVVVDAPAAPDIATVTLTAPQPGSTDVAITNAAFTWTSVAEADSYVWVLSAMADLSAPIKRAFPWGTAYTYTGTLDYDTPYYWQVLASGAGEPVGESDVSTFTTVVEAVVPPAPTYTCPEDGLVFTTQEALAAHWNQYHAPAAPTYTCPEDGLVFTTQAALAAHWDTYHSPAAEATPAYIWVIIGVGAVLVIGVLVLIIRTRRVA